MKLPTIMSDQFLEALPPEERKKLGKAGMTSQECNQKFARGEEIKLQRLCLNWLSLHGYYWEYDRPDKRTSGKKGRADIRACIRGCWLSAECKAGGEPLSREQAIEAVRLRNSGGRFVLVYCLADLIEAVHGIHADDR